MKMFRDIPSTVGDCIRNGEANYPMGIYITLVHVAAAVGFVRAFECSAESLLFAFVLWPIR